MRVELQIVGLAVGVIAATMFAVLWVLRASIEPPGKLGASGESESAGDDRHWPMVRAIFLILAIGTLAFSLYGSLVPFSLDLSSGEVNRGLHWSFSRTDMAANFLLLLPAGYFLTGAFGLHAKSVVERVASSVGAWSICGVITWINEFGQLLVTERVASWTDIVMQHLGATVGMACWWLTGSIVAPWAHGFLTNRRSAHRWIWLLELYLVGFVVYHVLPLDLTLNIGDLGKKYIEGRISLIPFADLRGRASTWIEIVRDVAIFVPIGALTTLWHTTRPRSLAHSLCCGLVIALALEAAQVIVQSRYASATDVVLGVVGIGLGHGLVRLIARDSAADGSSLARWTLVAIGWMSLLPLIFWYPYEMTRDTTEIRHAFAGFFAKPFQRLIMGNSPMVLIVLVLRDVACFLPLGMLWSQVVSRSGYRGVARRGAVVAAGLTIAIYAGGLELVQIAIPARTADITDWGIFVLAGWLGIAIGLFATRET